MLLRLLLHVHFPFVLQFDSRHHNRQGFTAVGELEHCVHYKVGEFMYITLLHLVACLIYHASIPVQFNTIR